LIQDHVASGVKLTCKDTFLTLEEFQQLLYIAVTGLPGTEVVNNFEEITIPPPTVLKPVRLWTGKQVITALLRLLCRPPLPQLHLDAKSRTPPTAFGVSEQEHVVIFRFGELLSGVLDKNAIGNSALGIVHAIYELYGSELAGLILSAFSRLFTYHLQNAGHTCGIEDLTLTEASDKVRAKLLTKVQTDSEIGLQKFLDSAAGVAPTALSGSNGFTPSERLRCENRIAHLLHSEKTEGKVKLDGAVQAVVNKSASDILKACLPSGLEVQFPKNNFSMMVLTGAKGSAVNQSQISCFLGQQALEGQRVPMMISGKTLPSFKPYDSRIRAGGFITDRFLTGVRPQEYYFHCMAGREGLVDTAVKTSRSGYLQRCLVKHLEELRVNYDLTVRDSAGSVVQFLYGEDGLDPMSAGLLSGKSNELLFLSRNHQALVHKYSVHQNYFEQGLEMESAKLHHQQYSAAKSTLESHSGSNSAKVKFSKRDFILARRKQHQDRPWSRYNMKKKWFLAEIVKVRKPSSSRSSTPHLPYLSYDIRYVDDNVVEKRVPANMRVKATPLVVNNGELQPEHNALIPLLKPGLPDPVMSVLGVSNNVGAVSENMQQKIKEYVAKNPDGVISGDTTETTVTGDGLQLLVWIKYLRSLACPGEAVGCVAAQSVGEPSTQMTLNTFHLAGHGGANVTLGIPRLREIIMTASKTLKTPTMMIPLAKGQTNETAKLLALRFSRVPLSKLLHHTLGIEVGEKIVRDKIRGVWERMYRVRFHFENPRIIQSCFGVSFEQLIDVVKTTVIKKLHAIITLELRRARASSKQTVVIKNTTSASRFSQAKSTEDGGEDEEKGESKAKQSDPDGVDSDAEDNDDIDDVDDVEQGTLKLGQRGEVTGYEDDDSDEEETGSVTGGGMLDTEALEMEEDDSDSLSELDDMEPSTSTTLDAVEEALKRLQASVHTKTARANAAPASKEKQSTKRDTSKELVGRVGNGRIVDVGGTLASSEAEGWVELNMAFPAHSRKLLMVQLAEQACAKASVRETKSIANAYPSECEIDGEKRFAVQTEGVNFEAAWDLPDVIADVNHIKSNDIWRVLCTYGVEAARQSIVSEITGVFGVYGINVNPRHLSLIADFMTRNGFYVPMNRMAMMECPSRFLQMSFETTATFLTQAALEGGVETLESPSARIVTGGVPRVGTGCFDVMLPL
jgi:DNA-directed RNA polymerase I subunit RPA1